MSTGKKTLISILEGSCASFKHELGLVEFLVENKRVDLNDDDITSAWLNVSFNNNGKNNFTMRNAEIGKYLISKGMPVNPVHAWVIINNAILLEDIELLKFGLETRLRTPTKDKNEHWYVKNSEIRGDTFRDACETENLNFVKTYIRLTKIGGKNLNRGVYNNSNFYVVLYLYLMGADISTANRTVLDRFAHLKNCFGKMYKKFRERRARVAKETLMENDTLYGDVVNVMTGYT